MRIGLCCSRKQEKDILSIVKCKGMNVSFATSFAYLYIPIGLLLDVRREENEAR